MKAKERRLLLTVWFAHWTVSPLLSAAWIVDCLPGVYWDLANPIDRCFDDLKTLEAEGIVERTSRPTYWSYIG